MTHQNHTARHACRRLLAVGLASAALGAAAAPSSTDTTFVAKAAMGGIAEVEAGNLAQQKGASDGVKQYGARLVQDHSKANDELKQIAGGKGMKPPEATDAEHRKAAAQLGAKSGAAFDKAFRAQMIADHKATIALFEKEAKGGSDADLKAFATKTLPDLREHLKMAEALK